MPSSSNFLYSLHSQLKALGSTLVGLAHSALSRVYKGVGTVKSLLLPSTQTALDVMPQTVSALRLPLPDSPQSLQDFALQSIEIAKPVFLDLARSLHDLLLESFRLFRQGLPELVRLARRYIGGLKTVLGGVAAVTVITGRVLAFFAGIMASLVVFMRPGWARYAPWIKAAIFVLECMATMSYLGIVRLPITPVVELGGLCLAGAFARRLICRPLLERVRDSGRSFWCRVTSIWRRPPSRVPWYVHPRRDALACLGLHRPVTFANTNSPLLQVPT